MEFIGFLDVKQKNLANGVVSWEYEQRRRNSCNAKVVGNVNTHNHAADPCRKETLQIKNADVVDAFETLAEDIGDDYQGLLDYFEDTYIGRPGRRQRRDPRFSHDI